VLQQRQVSVLGLGPLPEVVPLDAGTYAAAQGALAPGFFTVGQSLCYGDSGSPALAQAGAVVGVASQIVVPDIALGSGTASDCEATGDRGIYGSTFDQSAFLLGGYTAANATPWLEGQPDPRAALAGFGAVCTSDADCKSNVCIDVESANHCSQGCLETGVCPSGFTCTQGPTWQRCLPTPAPVDASVAPPPPMASGCDVSGRTWTEIPSRALALIVLTGLLVGRRKRSRGRGAP
jgi:hypothetical protein